MPSHTFREGTEAERLEGADGPFGNWAEEYSALVGPDDFICVLTEPEDRVWYRDLDAVVTKLNEQHEEIVQLREQLGRKG